MLAPRSKASLVTGVAVVSLSLLVVTACLPPSAEPLSSETVEIAARAFVYRLAGEFLQAGRSVDAPFVMATRNSSLYVMRRQVTAAEYSRCVSAGACKPTANDSDGAPDVPVVKVNWNDATAYAAWFSKQSGYDWRLPTDDEWAFFAGSRFHDDALSIAAKTDPSSRWLARYEKEAKREPLDQRPRPIGAFGANEYGVVDLSGNVWEWTNTCFVRRALDAAGQPLRGSTVNCGIRVVEGQHRAYVTDFVRDASRGGCAAGTPPSNLSFRLVREDAAAALIPKLRRILIRVGSRFCQSTGGQRWGCPS